MASSVASITSKALVHVCANTPDGSISCQYHMDISYDQDTFHCKLIASARLADSDKKVFVYLILDATNVKAITLHGHDEVPLDVAKDFIKQARCTTVADIVSLQLTLTQSVPLVVPDLALQHKTNAVKDIDTLLRLGRCETFTVYVPSGSVNHERLGKLCETLDRSVLKPAERVIKTLYAGAGYKIASHVDEIWSPNPPGGPPPYDPSTVPGASNDESSGPSNATPSNSSRAQGKRRSGSPDLHRSPSKRQLLTEKATLEPWQLAIAAQGAQIAALHAQLSTLSEQVQQLQRAPGVDAETQTDPVDKNESESSPDADSEPSYISHSQASTVENTIDDRLIMLEANVDERLKMLEENIIEEQTQRGKLDEKIEINNKEVCVHQMVFLFLSLSSCYNSFYRIAVFF
jgi:hypothetical protein